MTSTQRKEVELGCLAGSDVEFRAETIYFLVLDRFAAGNPDKDREDDEMFDAMHQDWRKYWGGDLQGVIDRLPYLKSLGASAVWTTRLFEQVESMTCDEHPQAPIHGYWTSDFKRINARWVNSPSEKRLFQFSDTTFDRLIAALHSQGMKYVLDIVCNHSSPETGLGKGRLYDDGKLIADFDNDSDGWYHHYGKTTDWKDEWQVQNCELAGLATFNENNICYRNHIKEAIRLWLDKGVDALRIDTVKHMPLWFWQEFTFDLGSTNPNLFRFGEWIYNTPDNKKAVEFANHSGMALLDFGFSSAVRECFSGSDEGGFRRVADLLAKDGVYFGATELVTFFENHDMPRLQSLGVSDREMDLALVLLLTTRGVPCLYYGCEQYLHHDEDGGEDPYNRPMMEKWERTPATDLVGILSKERKRNPAIQWGGQWPKWVDEDIYIYLRRYRDNECLVFLNKGDPREITVENLDYPDGEHACVLSGRKVVISRNRTTVTLGACEAVVLARHGPPVKAMAVARIQINSAPTEPGDHLAVIGNCPELGCWDLRCAVYLECVNGNTWFGEIPFNESAGAAIGYKYVIFSGGGEKPVREEITVRQRLVVPDGFVKWRDQWAR